MKRDAQELRDLILLASLEHVVFEGWTEAALEAGLAGLADVPGIGPKAGALAFPGGMKDMAEHFSEWADRRMAAEMARLDITKMRVRDRVATAVRKRLQVLAPYREAVRRLHGFLALPGNAGLGLRLGIGTVGEIWYAAGDESVDFNYYTKRALLAPVLAATVLYWLADEADDTGDYPDTWAFLDRRIAEVLKIPPLKGRLEKRLADLPSPARMVKRFNEARRARR